MACTWWYTTGITGLAWPSAQGCAVNVAKYLSCYYIALRAYNASTTTGDGNGIGLYPLYTPQHNTTPIPEFCGQARHQVLDDVAMQSLW